MDLIPRLKITIDLFFPDGKNLNRNMKRDKNAYYDMIQLHKEIFKKTFCSTCGSGFQKMATNLLNYYVQHKDEYIETEL